MFLADFKRQRHERKLKRRQENREQAVEGSDIDDAAMVPAKGFLAGIIELPTYRPKSEDNEMRTSAYVDLSISDVLRTISREAYLARCVLFETARLQRSLLSLGPLKLFQNARAVDMELIQLRKVLHKGDELIGLDYDDDGRRKKQHLILEGEPFQKALRMYFVSFYFVIPVCLARSEGL